MSSLAAHAVMDQHGARRNISMHEAGRCINRAIFTTTVKTVNSKREQKEKTTTTLKLRSARCYLRMRG